VIKRGKHAFRRQFDVAGIIRLGGEQSLGEWNKELSYFRLTSTDPNVPAAPKIAEARNSDGSLLYGQEPTALHVMFPSDDPDEIFDDAYELWRGSKKKDVKGVLLCRGDGEIAERIVHEDDPWERDRVQCPCPESCAFAAEHTPAKLRENGGSACGAVGRLRVICYRVSVLEIYEIRTGSINAFQGLRNKLLDIKSHPIFGGRLAGIPMILRRVPKKNRFGKTNYPVRIEVPTWQEWQEEARFIQTVQQKVLGTVAAVDQLPTPPSRPALPPTPESFPDEKVSHSAQAPVGQEPRSLSERLARVAETEPSGEEPGREPEAASRRAEPPPDDPMPEAADKLLDKEPAPPPERTKEGEGAAVAEMARAKREEATRGNGSQAKAKRNLL